jgi:hypothetical protein
MVAEKALGVTGGILFWHLPLSKDCSRNPPVLI